MRTSRQMPYTVPVRRELTPDERALLTVMLGERSDLAVQLETLKVVARCGCGECPAISFSDTADGEADTTFPWDDQVQYTGDDQYGNTVIATLIIRSGNLSELDVANLSGATEKWGLPSLQSLKNVS